MAMLSGYTSRPRVELLLHSTEEISDDFMLRSIPGDALGVDTGSGLSTCRSDVPAMQRGDYTEELSFEYLFETPTYVVGCPKAILYASVMNTVTLIYLFS